MIEWKFIVWKHNGSDFELPGKPHDLLAAQPDGPFDRILNHWTMRAISLSARVLTTSTTHNSHQ